MKLTFIEDEPKSLIVEFSDTDRGIPDLIKDKLLHNKDVDFVGVDKEHPERGNPRLIVKASKNPKKIVIDAVEELQEELKELSAKLPKS